MNGLALRISNAGGKKSKPAQNFMKLDVSNYFPHELLSSNEAFHTFVNASNVDEQLAALKPILESEASIHASEGKCNNESVQFLVKLLFNAEAKHPVKCFLARNITKSSFIQPQFSQTLSEEIKTALSSKPPSYKEYVGVLTKISSCIENFPPGVVAVKIVELDLAQYLDDCIRCCVETLRNSPTLSPTEKNEIYNLAHLALRLFLYIVQKISPENVTDLTSMFTVVRMSMRELFFDEDAPMDTKTVCGMVYLNMRILENGQESWVDILQSNPQDEDINSLLLHEASQLSLYSAIATVVSLDKLQACFVDDDEALLVLCKKILAIGEKLSSESVFILGVTRSLVQITKHIDKVSISSLGLRLGDTLLTFVWSHLEHHMDSVRHLTAQILANIVRYYSKLDKEGDPDALTALLEALSPHEEHPRKGYYLALTALAGELGAARLLARLPRALPALTRALGHQHVQASATTTLETLLQKHIKETDTKTIHEQWVAPILAHVKTNSLDSSVLNILESLLTRAVQLNPDVIHYILPYIKESATDLKCVLMLLSVARKSRVTSELATDNPEEWKGLISYQVLERTAIDAVEETRILSLSLIVESPKTTEIFSRGELNFILKYLKYNINAQSPNFRQLTLSMMKKFLKRLEDSYKVFKKQKEFTEDYYKEFLEALRSLCFDSLIPGANYSRRFVTLQVLVWCEHVQLDGYEKIWLEDYVEKLLRHLEDSYESNKVFALVILNRCPTPSLLRKKYSISLDLEDIVRQASSLKPTDCASAAYKLDLLRTKLPDTVTTDTCDETVPERVIYVLLQRLQRTLLAELEHCERSIMSAAVNAPMYGVLHCMVHLITKVDVDAISADQSWRALMRALICACVRVNAGVACVVNSASPEGHLPCDLGSAHPHCDGGLTLEDGRPVTAQMVLLCAWRSVKEVSLFLGEISSRLSISGEGCEEGTLTPDQMVLMGEHFTKLLAETKHRGAFEQAYVGFSKLLTRLWRCRSGRLHGLPRAWLAALMAAVGGAGGAPGGAGAGGALSVTRRGAGLPFMIQALVTTELQMQGNPKCFHQCMSTLLRLARAPPPDVPQSETAIETRVHSINILRALFRNSALDESVAGYVGEGLEVAVEGFEGGTWMERNSSTLLLSAVMARAFGPQRARPHMTGRIFFLRYPHLYDYLLDKLKAVNNSADAQTLRPSLYPILLILARLYPSSLEGTVSNLKLAAFVRPVAWCCASAALSARRLAARAALALQPPRRYLDHLEAMMGLICDKNIKRNYCHGILIQLGLLLGSMRRADPEPEYPRAALTAHVAAARWLLDQPCHLLADELLKVLNLLLWRFPSLVDKDTSGWIQMSLHNIIFNESVSQVSPGRDICMANAVYLYFILIIKNHDIVKIYDLIYKTLSHRSYEVVLTTLNFLLILTENFAIENDFQEHLDVILNRDVPKKYSKGAEISEQLHEYTQILCEILRSNKYLECQQKALKVLFFQKYTEKYIVQVKMRKKGVKLTDEIIIHTLIDCVHTEHDSLTHIYLACLSNYISNILEKSAVKPNLMLNVIRVVFACCCADNNEGTRNVVVGFIENHLEELFMMGLDGLSKDAKFEFKATIYAILVTILEDDDEALRQRTSNVILKLQDIFPNATSKTIFRGVSVPNVASEVNFAGDSYPNMSPRGDSIPNFSDLNEMTSKVISSRSAELLRELIANNEEQNVAIFVVLALLDFKSEVCMNDEVSDECRVFDLNEKYNIHLEETVWTKEAAHHINIIAKQTNANPLDLILNVLHSNALTKPIAKLCNNNLDIFEKIIRNECHDNLSQINPKVELFVSMLTK